MRRRVIFPNKVLPYLLLIPQLVITVVFFYWPAVQAVHYSVLLQDPFGLRTSFVWLENFQTILTDPLYLALRQFPCSDESPKRPPEAEPTSRSSPSIRRA